MHIGMSRLILALILLEAMSAFLTQPVAAQGGGNRAALVVRDGDGRITSRCVTFPEGSISGEELLNRSGLNISMKNWGIGKTVCSIDSYGCPPPKDCWCRCQGADCEYWAYYHWTGDAWQFSSVGVSSFRVRDGALEGLAWGAGTYGSSGAIPPTMTFDAICLAPAAAPAPDNPFRLSFIPGYAAYILMAAFLVSAGAVVVRRRRET